MRTPGYAKQQHPLLAARPGRLARIDNRKLAKLAKLAGAPNSKAAGVELHVKLGETIQAGDPLCTLHAESRGELAYALDFADSHGDIFDMERS
jgi:thymidine phosphorylase